MRLEEAVSLAVDFVLREGFSDITTENLELILIEKFRNDFEKEMIAQLKKESFNEMGFNSIQYILTPKNRYIFDYRKAAIISPSCAIKFMALVFQVANQIESARVPVHRNTVFSYRFNVSKESIFNKEVGYALWMQETKNRAEKEGNSYIVSCDIAAFYDRLNIHRIESTLLSIGVSDELTKKINELLLFWSKKDSYGVPVGNVASRILAEAALIDIDNYLLDENINFTRYVDDYRLFAPDLLTAQAWMNKLTARLFKDGLMLNTGKTKIRKIGFEHEASFPDNSDSPEKILKEATRLTGGYNRIPKKFIMPASEKHAKFKLVDLRSEMKVLTSKPIVEFEGIQKIIIAALVQKEFSLLVDISKTCINYLYGLDYFIDMLIKNAEFIPGECRSSIADFYSSMIRNRNLYFSEWHSASVAKLLSQDGYYRKEILLMIFKSQAKDIAAYASIIALDGLRGKLTRSDFIAIREFFDRSDEWERRRLIHLSDALPKEERKAWGRAIKTVSKGDFFARKYSELIAVGKSLD